MRKLGIAILVLVVLVVIALAVIPKLIDVNQYHDRIVSELSQKLGRQVTLGQMSLGLLPPKFVVQNAVVADDPAFQSQRPFAQAQQLAVHVKLLPLLTKQLEISSIVLERPQVEMIRNAQGVWNFATLGQKKNPPQQQSQQQLSVGDFEISDGTLAITDLQKHQSRAVYDHIDAALRDFAPGKPFSVELAAHLPGQGKQVAKLEGRGGPINDQSMLNTPFDGTIHLDQVAVSGVQKFLNSEALQNIEATLTGSADVKNENGSLASKGSIKIENARVRGTDIGYPINVDYNATDNLTNDVIQIASANIKLGDTPISLSGNIDTRATPSMADMQVKANNVSIAEMARLASAFGVAMTPGMQASGNLNADIHVQGALSSPAMNGNLSASNLNITGSDVPAPVKVPSIALQMTPQQIASNQFTASSGNTNLNARFTMFHYTTPQPQIDATLQTANASVADLLSMAKAAGMQAAQGMSGSGQLSLNVHAVGPIKNTGSMQLSGDGDLQNASIKTAQMTQPLQVHTAQMKFTSNTANLTGVSLTLGSTNANGQLSMRNFEAPNVQFQLTADKLNATELEQILGTSANQQQAPAKKASLDLVPRANAQAAGAQPSILNKMTGGGTVQVGTITYNQLTLQNTKSNVTLNNGIVKLDPVNTVLYGGNATGAVTVDTRGAKTLYNVALKTQKVDANSLLGSVSSMKDVLYGLLASNIQSSFASSPNVDLAQTLNGRVSLNLTNGKLTKVDLLNQLSSIGKFTSFSRSAQNFTALQQLGGDFDIRNGIATTNNLKALIEGGTVAATGAVNLVNQAVDMRLTAVLSKGYSQQVGGTGIGGLMNTALANKNGELVIPVLVSGTFDNLKFAPDTQAIAQMKLNNLLPSFGNPGQMSSGILGAITGKGGQGGVGGVLDAITGKQKSNQQYQQQPGAAAQQANQGVQQQQQPNTQDIVNGVVGLFGNKKKNQQQQQQPPPPK